MKKILILLALTLSLTLFLSGCANLPTASNGNPIVTFKIDKNAPPIQFFVNSNWTESQGISVKDKGTLIETFTPNGKVPITQSITVPKKSWGTVEIYQNGKWTIWEDWDINASQIMHINSDGKGYVSSFF